MDQTSFLEPDGLRKMRLTDIRSKKSIWGETPRPLTDYVKPEKRNILEKMELGMKTTLAPIPVKVKIVKLQNGISMCPFIGDPWEMEGDGRLVFKSTNYKIHNPNFRKKLFKMAGKEYQKEVKELRQGKRGKGDEEVKPTSGANPLFYAIIHVPIAPYKNGNDFDEYNKEMLQAMERGLNKAINQELWRVVLCV